MHTCKAMQTEHAVKKAKRKTKEWRSYGSSKIPKTWRSGRNDLNLARSNFDVTLITACGGNWSTCAPRGGNLQLGFLAWRSSDVSSLRDTVHGFEQGLLPNWNQGVLWCNSGSVHVCFFFLCVFAISCQERRKKQLEARCQPLICKISEGKHPCRTGSDFVDMSIWGLCECPKVAHGQLVNMSKSTCNKTNGLVSCLTSMWNRLSTNWQKLSDSSSWAWEACCKRTLKQLRLHDLRSRFFAAANARHMLTKQQKLGSNSDYETPGEIERAQSKKKERKKKSDGNYSIRNRAMHLLRCLSRTFLQLRQKI